MNSQEKLSFRESARNIGILIRMMWGLRPLASTVWLALLFVSASFPILQVWLQKESVDSLTGLSAGEVVMAHVMLLVGLYFFAPVLSSILSAVQTYFYSLVRIDVDYRLKRKLGETAASLPYYHFEDPKLYDQMKFVQNATNRNGLEMVNSLFHLGQQVLSLVGLFGLLWVTHWALPIALILSAIPGIAVLAFAKKLRYHLSVMTTEAGRKMEYTFGLMMRRDAAKEVRMFDLRNFLLERWSNLYFPVQKRFLRQATIEGFSGAAGVAIMSFASVSVAFVLVYQIGEGTVTIGEYVALTSAVLSVQALMGGMMQSFGTLFESSLFINRMFRFLQTESTQNPEVLHRFPTESFDGISVNQLTFRYPNREHAALQEVTLRIRKGERIAIVGENGSGKSTLAQCLLGLYPPAEGTIHFGDREIREIEPSSLYDHVSAVFQDFFRYSLTLGENVGIGKTRELDNEEKLIEALEKVNLLHLLKKLEFGIQTPLGREFLVTGGQELSGGQWQRIAIARAILRDAEMLVLDEPTAALDPIAELEIFKQFLELSKGKTAIMISHRLGPARYADQIFVMKEGRLIEQGTHEELMQIGGEYSRMFLAQAEWYRES